MCSSLRQQGRKVVAGRKPDTKGKDNYPGSCPRKLSQIRETKAADSENNKVDSPSHSASI